MRCIYLKPHSGKESGQVSAIRTFCVSWKKLRNGKKLKLIKRLLLYSMGKSLQ